jgi:hypothetical protein
MVFCAKLASVSPSGPVTFVIEPLTGRQNSLAFWLA